MNFKKDVVYYFDEMIGTYHYAYAHPMKPLRVAMTNEIVQKYELNQHFESIVIDLRSRIMNLQSCIISMPQNSLSRRFIPINILI
jgi:acetoin utilization deacetylase AcuC-like enzyme